MSFGDQVHVWTLKVDDANRDLIVDVAQLCHESIQVGSAITGAPGQPVEWGTLKASWQIQPEPEGSILVSTNLEYAESIEDGVQASYKTKKGTIVTPSPMTLRTKTGGFHSVKMTIAAFDRLVDHAVAQRAK
jgi:hypothetical protein